MLTKERLLYIWRRSLNFIPGLLILIFGMIGVYACVTLSEEYRLLQSEYRSFLQGTQPDSILELAHEARLEKQMKQVETAAIYAYWSVIFVGMCGFVLLVLNAQKLNSLEKINESKRADVSLLETRLAAMEATLDGIVLIGKDGKTTYINNALMNMFGIREAEIEEYIGSDWLALMPENMRMEVEEEVFLALDQDGRWSANIELPNHEEVQNSDAKKSRRQVEFTLARTKDGSSIGTARDITHKIEADLELKDVQSQLYQAQKMEAVGRLAGGIAHDFNNILAAMNGYAEFLVEDIDEETPQFNYAENILKAGYQARALVDQMLTFSRHRGTEFAVMDILDPMNECIAMLKASMPKSVELHTELDLPVSPIEGNPTQVAQVLMNLSVNANDAMEDEKGTLKLGLKQQGANDIIAALNFGKDSALKELPSVKEAPLVRMRDQGPEVTELLLGGLVPGEDYVCLSVEDTGSGMSRAIMEFIFEPFFTTKPVNKGTGLGLSTVHGVIGGHRGALYLQSTVGKGTRFELYFPTVKKQSTVMVHKEDAPAEFIPAHVLLVEDQIEVLEMTKKMLERMNYSVDTALSGAEALKVLIQNPGRFQLVVTDQNMPKMNGLELVYQVHLEYPELPFILLSGYSEQKLQDLMKEHPAIKAILRKPVKRQEFADKVAHVLALAKAA